MSEIFQHTDVLKAIITVFIFQGAFVFIGLYMLLVYAQTRKKDYFLYGIYSLLFAIYFFIKTDLVLEQKFFTDNTNLEISFLIPLLFLLTGVYVKFINVFAEIKKHHLKFSNEIDWFTKSMYALSAVTFFYLIITKNSASIVQYQSYIFIPLHLYSVYAVIRAFLVIKSHLRYYILISNIFLITFTVIGLYSGCKTNYSQGLYANDFFGFYNFSASQLGVFLEMLCFSLGLGYKFNLIEIEKDRVKKLNELKTKLYTNISHEIKTPITLISGLIEKQLENPKLSENNKKELSLVRYNSQRLLNLMNQLLDLSKLQTGNLSLAVSKGNINVLLKQIISVFKFKAAQKNIKFKYQIQPIKDAWFDSDIVEKIITNLIANAVKYTPKNGKIFLETYTRNDQIIISLINDSNSLTDKELNKLYTRYYQNNSNADGVGIGLSLVKELVILSHGKISTNSLNKDEIQFTVTLPIARSLYNNSEIIEHKTIENSDGLNTAPLIKNKQHKPLLLIVEDETDIRQFISSIFKDDYRIKKAVNGEQGIKNAIKYVPDIIISDVMMPKADGIELCNTLKTDKRTSHIPIILLTAKSGDQNEIKGLKTGVDDYITKPFNSKKLKLRVEKLVELRQHLQKSYSKSFELKAINSTSEDQEFLKKLQFVLNKNISQPSFTPKDLAKEMLMSRMQLHRKLKAITGLSTTGFIRNERLKQSVNLLKKSDQTISEIAYQVGFNTPSYFIKCFKDVYKTTPSEYI